MCAKLGIIATLSSATLLGERPSAGTGFVVPTLDYIPGTVVRGALASLYLNANGGKADSTFYSVFCSDAVRFENLMPENNGIAARLIPRSARTCKGYPGFKRDEGGRQHKCHGVSDFLLKDMPAACPQCGAPLEEEDGYCYSPTPTAAHYASYDVNQQISAHTEIEDTTGRPRESILFARQGISEGSKFRGCIVMYNSAVLPADTLFRRDGNAWKVILKLGQSRSRGWGTAELELYQADREPLFPAMRQPIWERIAAFQDGLALRGGGLDALCSDLLSKVRNGKVKVRIGLNLWSDCIALDRWLRPVTSLTPDYLRDECGLNFDKISCTPVRAFTRTRRVSGWNAAHGLPKNDDIALRSGSAFLCEFTCPQDKRVLLEFLKALENLEEAGIGYRRNEGFGRVLVCDPFHVQLSELNERKEI